MKKQLLSITAALFLSAAINPSNAQEGASLNFNGINNDAQISGINIANSSFTMEAWVKRNSIGTYDMIFSQGTAANDQGLHIGFRDNNSFTFAFYGDDITTATTYSDNNWHHWATTYDATSNTQTIYLDGALVETRISNADFFGTGNIYIGNSAWGGNEIDANIDEVRIWNVARTQAEIQNYMNCKVPQTATGLVAAYNFNDGIRNADNTTISSVNDVTGNGYTASLNGFALTGTTSNFVNNYRSDYLDLQSSIGSNGMVDRMSNGWSIDYNNDGWNDVMVISETSETRLYLNNKHGNFSTHTVIHAPGSGYIRDVADMDADGDKDYVITNATTVTAYINNGNGTFSAHPGNLMNGAGQMVSAKIADINNDNKADLILGNYDNSGTEQNEIWLNSGTVGNPVFTFSVGYTNNIYKTAIATGDVDEDGDMDILMGSYSNGGTLYLNNNNDGTFTEGTAPVGYSGGAELLDWNQDGHLDFINYEGYNHSLMVRLGNGTGIFSTLTVLLSNSVMNMGKLVDINSDGFLDFVASNWGGNGLVYLNNGCSYTLQPSCNYSLGRADNFVTVSDFNNDGTPDVFCQARDFKSSFYMNYLAPVTNPSLPLITSAPTVDACYGTDVVLTVSAAGPETIKWYDFASGGSLLASGSNYTVTMPAVGTVTYYVGAENTNGCITSSREAVILNVNPTPQITASSGNVHTCGDVATDFGIVVDGSNNTYAWFYDLVGGSDFGFIDGSYSEINYDTDTMTVQQPLSANYNNYYVYCEVTNEFNCVSRSTNDTIWANDIAIVSINPSGTSACAGMQITLAGIGASSYVWSDGITDNTAFTATVTHTYTVTGTDANGCQDTSTIEINVTQLPSTATSLTDVTISANENGAVYQWLDCNNANAIISGETNQNYTATVNGSYAVEVILNGCADTSACVTINNVGLKSATNESGINIFPNPAKESVTIESDINATISVINVIGQTVIEIKSSGRSTKIDTSNLITGAYFVKVKTDKGTIITKLIIE